MSNEKEIDELREAVINFDSGAAKSAAQKVIDSKVDPIRAIKEISVVIRDVGDKFESGELFLPHLVMAADAMKAAIDIFETHLPKEKIKETRLGTVVIGTVKGDIHDIGAYIMGMMLTAAGFEVINLGKDVPIESFINKAQEVDADIIGLSSLLLATMSVQRELIEELNKRGLRDRFKVMVGGGPVTKEWAKEIGANGQGYDAIEAVEVAKELIGAKAIN